MRGTTYYLTTEDLALLARSERRRQKTSKPRLTAVRLSPEQEDFLRREWDKRKELGRVVHGR